MPHSFLLLSPATQYAFRAYRGLLRPEDEAFLEAVAQKVAEIFNRITGEELVAGKSSLAHIVVRRNNPPTDFVVMIEADWTEERVVHYDELYKALYDEFSGWDKSLTTEIFLNVAGMPPQAGPHGILPRLRDKDNALKPPEQARLEHWRGLSGP